MKALDTSVAVAGLLSWHEAHAAVAPLLADAVVPAQVLVEAFSVLTRLPRAPSPQPAADLLARAFPEERVLVMSRALAANLPRRCAEVGVSGGAIYDAAIGYVAAEHGASLCSRDRRAEATYRAVGVEVDWVA